MGGYVPLISGGKGPQRPRQLARHVVGHDDDRQILFVSSPETPLQRQRHAMPRRYDAVLVSNDPAEDFAGASNLHGPASPRTERPATKASISALRSLSFGGWSSQWTTAPRGRPPKYSCGDVNMRCQDATATQ